MSDDVSQFSPVRLAAVTFMRSIVGYTAPSREYCELIAPADTPAKQEAISVESGCMQVELAKQDFLFVLPPREPYVNGSAPELLERRCKGSPMAPGGALRLATLENPPQPGDGIWYGKGPGGPEHVDTCMGGEWVEGGVCLIPAIAGGAETTDEHGRLRQTIAAHTRRMHWNGHRWMDNSTGRPIIGVLDLDLLAQMYDVRAAD